MAPLSVAATGLPATASAPVAAHWWQTFGDHRLNDLVARALQDNPDLAQAQARLQHAMALAAWQDADAGLHAALNVGVTRQRYSENAIMPAPLAGSVWDTGRIAVDAAWSPDVFGLQAAELAAAVGQARAAQADAAAAAIALSGQASRKYIFLAQLLAQRAVDVRQLEQRQELLAIVSKRVHAGLDSQVELVRVEGAVPEARAALEATDERITLARRQLAVLTGQAPQALDTLAPDLGGLALGEVPVALGSDLLGRRPDVVAARWRVEAATGGVDAARARFYPNIHLSAFVGLQALGLGQLLAVGSREWGATPALSLPLFDRDRLQSQLGASRAGLDEAVARYNSLLLQAVREASDALSSGQSIERQRREQLAALAAAQTAWNLALERYRAGLGNVLPVLEAEAHLLVQRRLVTDLQARCLQARVALLTALGGGWVDDTGTVTAANR